MFVCLSGDSLSYHNGNKFSTYDQDNDGYFFGSCAARYKGAWWYNSCHRSNLNGIYHNGAHKSYADGVNWKDWKGYNYSLKFTEMKMRPASVKASVAEEWSQNNITYKQHKTNVWKYEYFNFVAQIRFCSALNCCDIGTILMSLFRIFLHYKPPINQDLEESDITSSQLK